MLKGLNKLSQTFHQSIKDKGFYEKPHDPAVYHMLIVTEIAEATESVRKGEPDYWFDNGKPEGEAVELADALIRIFDYMAYRGWDVEAILEAKNAYNNTRPYKHGKKF